MNSVHCTPQPSTYPPVPLYPHCQVVVKATLENHVEDFDKKQIWFRIRITVDNLILLTQIITANFLSWGPCVIETHCFPKGLIRSCHSVELAKSTVGLVIKGIHLAQDKKRGVSSSSSANKHWGFFSLHQVPFFKS